MEYKIKEPKPPRKCVIIHDGIEQEFYIDETDGYLYALRRTRFKTLPRKTVTVTKDDILYFIK